MKKLMIAACAIAFAVVTQASTVKWNSGAVYAPGADGNGYAEGNPDGYIVCSGEGYLAVLTVGDSYKDGVIGDVYNNLGAGAQSSVIDKNDAMTGTTADVLAYGTHYAQLIITDAEGNKLISDVFTFETSTMVETANILVGEGGNNIKLASGAALDENYGAFGAGWTAAPEPTSGMLLLIGVGALALRRRRA